MSQTCPHCLPGSFALRHVLKESHNMRIVCDSHPLIQGHILLIPCEHVPCIGSIIDDKWDDFLYSYQLISSFMMAAFGHYAAFEHGIVGQSVYHAHIHFLPFYGTLKDIIPELDHGVPIESLEDIREMYSRDLKYLFLDLQGKMYSINSTLGKPRFFRDRFAQVLGVPERGNWQKMSSTKVLKEEYEREIRDLKNRWQIWISGELN